MEFENSIKPKCSMLIDQNKYIKNDGGSIDPLGHTCYNDADYSDGIHFYCNECKDKILKEMDNNITKPNFNSVQAWAMMCELIKSGTKIII
ncbi:MAG: hypothetical protein ACFFDN_36145 [Candidatus Hodarchaeota archaeon]